MHSKAKYSSSRRQAVSRGQQNSHNSYTANLVTTCNNRLILNLILVIVSLCSVLVAFSDAILSPESMNLRISLPALSSSSPSSFFKSPSNLGAPSSGLSCREQYEPICEIYDYVRFWNKRFDESDCYQSPLRVPYNPNDTTKYNISHNKFLLFEPDRGGWNNIRMAAETAMILAHASGRTLVLPPEEKWYLLDSNKKKTGTRNHLMDISTFNTFFDMSKLTESIDIIPMKEYMERIAMKGLLREMPDPRKVSRLGIDHDTRWLWKYLERTSYVREWEPGKMFIGFNLSVVESRNGKHNGDRGGTQLSIDGSNIVTNIHTGQSILFGDVKYGKRAKLLASHNRKLVPYDKEFHSHRSIYFPGDYRSTHRILTHFYSYVYFADHKREHFYKRFVRDRLHYHDEIFCAASKVLKLIHAEAALLSGEKMSTFKHNLTDGGNTTEGASFHAYHIRRGDFQYKVSIRNFYK